MEKTFESPRKVSLFVDNKVGSVTVGSRQTDLTTVYLEATSSAAQGVVDRATVESVAQDDRDEVRVVVPWDDRNKFRRRNEVRVRVVVPDGADVEVLTASADIDVAGDLGTLSLKSASGDVTTSGTSTSATAKTASGDITVGIVDGPLRMQSASGKLRAGSVEGLLLASTESALIDIDRAVGGLDLHCTSGDIRLGQTAGDATIAAISGDVRIASYSSGRMRARSVSGKVEVGIPPGLTVAIDAESISGKLRSDIALDDRPGAGSDTGPVVSVEAHSVSGDVVIRRAAESLVA